MNFTLVTRGIEIPKEIPADWQNLIKGLLTRDHEKRWGSEQVRQWIAGKKNIPVFYASESVSEFKLRKHRPCRFLNEDYFELEALTLSLAEHWDEGVKRMKRGIIAEWIKKEIQNGDLASLIMDIGEDSRLSPDQKLMVGLLALDPKLPLTWRGDIINKEWLATHPEEAANILEGTVPEWLERLRDEHWLTEMRAWRANVLQRLLTSGIPYEKHLVDRMIVSPPEKIQEVALEVWNNYAGSTDKNLNKLFQQTSWTWEDAILLVACDRKLLLTEKQKGIASTKASNRQLAKKSGIGITEIQLSRVADLESDRLIAEVNQLREDYPDDGRLSPAWLGKLLHGESLEDEMRLIVACIREGLLHIHVPPSPAPKKDTVRINRQPIRDNRRQVEQLPPEFESKQKQSLKSALSEPVPEGMFITVLMISLLLVGIVAEINKAAAFILFLAEMISAGWWLWKKRK